jgi:plasmid stabilization system protein ParE
MALELIWGDEAARRFVEQVEKKVATLASMPFIGKRHEVIRAVRSIPVEPYHLLYYTVRGQTLHVLNLIDNRRR